MIDTNKLAKHNIYIDENGNIIIKRYGQRAYIKGKNISAVELSFEKLYSIIILCIALFIISIYAPGDFKPFLISLIVFSVLIAYFTITVKIYVAGYKTIGIQGGYHSMKELYEELQKLIKEK